MDYLVLFLIGGFFNTYKFHQKFSHHLDDEMPHKDQGYLMAFAMGVVFYGGALSFLYWLLS